MQHFIKNLGCDKINMARGNPIKMSKFLSFLNVEVIKNEKCRGADNGWTEYKGENGLIIHGGVVRPEMEYLDCVEYGNRLQALFHNYVNPFYLFDIMTKEGKDFFIDYYGKDIQLMIDTEKATEKRAKENREEIEEFLQSYTQPRYDQNSLEGSKNRF